MIRVTAYSAKNGLTKTDSLEGARAALADEKAVIWVHFDRRSETSDAILEQLFGFHPLAIYARRAGRPLLDQLDPTQPSWDMLGTNLSYKTPEGEWATDTNRLLLMDRKDFNVLGVGIDDLIEAFVQTVMATVAIDQMAQTLHTKRGRFRMKLFASLNDDPALLDEILV